MEGSSGGAGDNLNTTLNHLHFALEMQKLTEKHPRLLGEKREKTKDKTYIFKPTETALQSYFIVYFTSYFGS